MRTDNKTIVIAEAGVNHNGSVELARKLIKSAAEAGADYVKFQTFKTERLVTRHAEKAAYQSRNMGTTDDSQYDMLKRLELSEDEFEILALECKKAGIGFLSTPFDEESVEFLSKLGMEFWKIPSGEITNLPLLRKIGAMKGRVILSTGMSSLKDVDDALNILSEAGTPRTDVILLHCTTQYPAPLESVNLKAMDSLAELGCAAVGYSDHTEGIVIPIAAAARGAYVIEKHFTLDRNLPGPDHKASLEPSELADMVRAIRSVNIAMGDGIKDIADAEKGNVNVARKSIVASCHIKKGEILSEKNLTVKRPGTGLSPMMWDKVVSTAAVKDYEPDEQIIL